MLQWSIFSENGSADPWNAVTDPWYSSARKMLQWSIFSENGSADPWNAVTRSVTEGELHDNFQSVGDSEQ